MTTGKAAKAGRAGLNIASGMIPFVGGILSAIASGWGETEQEHANNMLRQSIRSRTMISAFDRVEQYELTELGKQSVHYAMNELAPRLTFSEGDGESSD